MSNTNGSYEYYLGSSSSGISEIEEVIEDDQDQETSRDLYELVNFGRGESSTILKPINEEVEGSLFSIDVHEGCVYIAVGKKESSIYAVSWALSRHTLSSTTTMIYLVHIFPETKHIPTPLGKLPKSQVSPEQVEIHMEQERGKRRQLLQKYLTMCSSSYNNNKINVDTILIESDDVAKAILDLIPILHIRKLVLGSSKSNAKKLKLRRGGGGGTCIAEQVVHNAPEICEVNVIWEGHDVNNEDQTFESPSPSPRPSTTSLPTSSSRKSTALSASLFSPRPSTTLPASPSFKLEATELKDSTQERDPFSCMCFGSKAT
ncbi:hypothetical protein ACFE04_029316 [Oxalis oulophora]